ncbi:MAG: bifunctional UDP-N-acetylglucosamine diphosphorylase/glucosamine-1-phosphate N-acetyltransferase GlmU [Acidobacteriota bacterium]
MADRRSSGSRGPRSLPGVRRSRAPKGTKRRGPHAAGAAPDRRVRAVVLAAGVGSRMLSAVPKVLHRVGGRTLVEAVLDAAEGLSPSRVVVVLGAGRERVEAALAGRSVAFARQEPPLGTGDAVRQALPALGEEDGPILVLSGDTPLLQSGTLAALVERQRRGNLDLALLTFRPPEPGEFGRVVRDAGGRVRRIVEAKNATARERKIPEVNAGVYCFAARALRKAAAGLTVDAVSGEYYLTDAVGILVRAGGRVEAVVAEDWREAWGVNTRRDLAAAEEIEHRRRLERALDAGATIVDPATTRLGPRVRLEPDAILHPFVCLEGETSVGEGAEVLSFTRIVNSALDAGAVVGPHCELDGARVGARSRVGPFARMRPGSVVEQDVRVGNFVETKNTILHDGVKAQHLAYLGDAEVGARSNIGAGVITCNYDGSKKHRTTIGEGVFVGSDAQLVAPVTVGRGAYVGAGATITEDVPEGALALSRVPQTNVEGWVERRKAKQAQAEAAEKKA